MPSIAATQSTTTLAANPIGFTTRIPKQVLGSDDFMKLLSTQMANQDPLKPMEDTAFVSQMASFSSLAQMNQLTKDFSLLRSDTNLNTANGYLGKTVTVKNNDTTLPDVTGIVSSIDSSATTPMLVIDGESYSLSSLKSIQQAPLTNDFALLRSDTNLNTATSFLGRTVTVKNADASLPDVTGVVTGVDASGASPQIVVNGAAYSLSSVKSITQTLLAGSSG